MTVFNAAHVMLIYISTYMNFTVSNKSSAMPQWHDLSTGVRTEGLPNALSPCRLVGLYTMPPVLRLTNRRFLRQGMVLSKRRNESCLRKPAINDISGAMANVAPQLAAGELTRFFEIHPHFELILVFTPKS